MLPVGGEDLDEGGKGSRPPAAGLEALVAEVAVEMMAAAVEVEAAILACWSCPCPCVAEL